MITSTGTAAGNAAGAEVEALTAGTPLLHITSTVDAGFTDRDRAPIHDVPRQPDMLRAVSKSCIRMLDLLPERLQVDDQLRFDVARARAQGKGALRGRLGPYADLAEALTARVAAGGHPWVRDVTISNSTFGNRYTRITEARLGVHALGSGIGQGVPMGVGAALPGAETGTGKAVVLIGDGSTQLCIGEMTTAVPEQAPLVYMLMNDRAYGVIRNIQDAQYDSRHHYSALQTPDFATHCASIWLAHRLMADVHDFGAALDAAPAAEGTQLIEVDMVAIGPFVESFSGPPAGAAGNKV